MFTIPTVVTSKDLKKRSYITFYHNEVRIREYNGKSIGLTISPNRASTQLQRFELLEKLKYEYHKALEAGTYPGTKLTAQQGNSLLKEKPKAKEISKEEQASISLLFKATKSKLRTKLSNKYKRNLKAVYRQFRDFMSEDELKGSLMDIKGTKIDSFLAQFSSTNSYYMNKRRDLGVLFNAAGRLIDEPIKVVKSTEHRRVKARLHQKYEKSQLKPILNYLRIHYPNLHLCCLLTYSSWLRPHEEVRLLTLNDFKNDYSEVHLTGGENKGGQVRVVYIPDYVREELIPILSTLDRDDNLFTRTPQPFNEYYFNTQWSRAWEKMYKLGLVFENQTIYSFRHTAAVLTYRKTKDVHLLQKLLGHSSIVVTLKYLRTLGELNTDELKAAAPQLD